MAARVTEVEVEEIIEVDSSLSLTPFITAANIIVNDNLSDSSLSIATATLKEIERWLAAHLTQIRSNSLVRSEGVKGVTQAFQYRLGLNLQSTMYGQQAMMLDPTGTLAKLNKGEDASTEATVKHV